MRTGSGDLLQIRRKQVRERIHQNGMTYSRPGAHLPWPLFLQGQHVLNNFPGRD
jgi:hypothetical protein